MARGHIFLIAVLLAAAAVAGLLAVTRTAQSSPAASVTDPAISYRLQKLDRLEAALEKELAAQSRQAGTGAGAPTVVYTRAGSPVQAADHDDDDHEHSSDDEHEDDRDD